MKKALTGSKEYTLNRCAKYEQPEYSRIRLAESEVESQVAAVFDHLRIEDERLGEWFGQVLLARTREIQRTSQD